ncbi:modification methylase [Candidatus Woesearchaeota archaeon]|nr:modification methylase [Candidatus Woesearchaeota archaeon]
MRTQIIQVEEIPTSVPFNSTLEISNNIHRHTHGFFKYPCKFIPNIPRWAILKYTKEGDLVLDPFAGSGTTLVEAVMLNRNALGVDFDKFSQLLCNTKTLKLSKDDLNFLSRIKDSLFNNVGLYKLPDIYNIEHWFPKENIKEFQTLKSNIDKIKDINERVYNFLLVCFASSIRKCSFADDTSPKPYVSSRIKKNPQKVKTTFYNLLDYYFNQMDSINIQKIGKSKIIGDDARNIKAEQYTNKVDLSITSPPYINAFDYVRSLRLENSWLGFYGDTNIIEIKKKQVGTEVIPIKDYIYKKPHSNSKKIDFLISKIYEKDKKRAFVVYKFFKDMELNINQVHKLLKSNSHYIIVVGDSTIRNIKVDTHNILIDIAKTKGFQLENLFSYIIKNRYLRIPRKGRGGLIKKDWVIDLVKI